MKRIHRTDQAGMVAIIVTMIMMFVITLIVLGFSEVTRHNQREALDTQLGTQAYYAAETGVNDVVNSVNQGLTPASTSCDPFNAKAANGAAIQLPRKLKADGSVANTCLMINNNPSSLIADSIAPSAGTVQWHVKNANGNPFRAMTFTWSADPTASGSCMTAFKTYPKATSWNCTHALLRVDMLNASGLAGFDASTLANATSTIYFQPTSSAPVTPTLGPISFFGGGGGGGGGHGGHGPGGGFSFGTPSAYQGSCHPSAGLCTATVNTYNVPSGDYYVRVTAYYATAKNVVLRATDSTGNVKFTDGQIIVDSTGRAQDQIKRIRVRIPLGSTSTAAPVFGLQTTDTICKNLTVLASNNTYDDACNWP